MTKLRHYDNWGTARFITFSCYHRLPLLKDEFAIECFLKHLDSFRNNLKFKVYGYVVMPDHVHLVLHPPSELRLGVEIGRLKALSTRDVLARWRVQGNEIPGSLQILRNGAHRTVFWQRRCYDHNCRSVNSVMEKIKYCHNNPVQANLISHPSQWRWSSYNWYQGMRDVPIDIDLIE